MKKQMLIGSMVVLAVLFSVGGSIAQDDKKMKMDMTVMQKSPHHAMMMAHRQNVLTFARALRDMAKDGKFEDVELARGALVEIKRGMEKMDEIQQAHMGQISVEMREKMKPMMEKMQAEKAATREHVLALEKALVTDSRNPLEVEKHAAALVLQLEKMGMSDKKMAMPGKSKI